ncbi:AaceriADL161Cp [[Ashbya] aceris (nom. inval.)]|nr:AaceriADL161Cp [[Ashbya] aceris (nom. inval.)]
MGKKYLLFMVQVHVNFRRAELESLAELHGVKVDFSSYREDSPFMVVELEGDEQARQWIRRAILCRAIYEYWGEGSDYAELHASIRGNADVAAYTAACRQSTFKFEFESYGGAGGGRFDRVAQIEQFAYLGLEGKIRLKAPQETFTVVERYENVTENIGGEKPVHLYFGRLVQRSDRLHGALEKYDLKKRPYKGTTSFEAELSLVSANIAQVKPMHLMYDPFAGTGSFLVAGSHYGALVLGSDIDGRMIRGKGSQTIGANFRHYGQSHRFLDVLTMDFTHNALREDLPVDTILCDPPYGIRESIKVLGAREPERFRGKEDVEIDGVKAYLRPEYIPTKKPCSLDAMLDQLLQFSAERLPIGGRLAFWMPTANDDNVETVVPLHPNLELLYNCEQEFNKWSRRLLVYANRGPEFNGPTNSGANRSKTKFRDRYFSGFN